MGTHLPCPPYRTEKITSAVRAAALSLLSEMSREQEKGVGEETITWHLLFTLRHLPFPLFSAHRPQAPYVSGKEKSQNL